MLRKVVTRKNRGTEAKGEQVPTKQPSVVCSASETSGR